MRITIVTSKLLYGGVEVLLSNMIKVLKEQYGYEISLVSLLPSSSEFYSHLPKDVNAWIALRSDEKTKIGKIFYYLETEFITYRIRKIIMKTNPDVVIGYVETYDVVNLIAKLKVPKIVYVHNIVRDPNAKTKHEKLIIRHYKQALNKIDNWLFVSDSCKNEFSKVYDVPKEKARILYNYVPIEQIRKKSIMFNVTPRQKDVIRFCYAGRLSEEKGVIRLIKACLKLRTQGYKFELLIIGSGVKEQECRMLVNSNHAEDTIKMIEFCDNPYPYIVSSDWYVCASIRESFGLSVLEAISLGVKVVSTRAYGTEDIIRNIGGGILIDNSDDAIMAALGDILNHKIQCPTSHDIDKIFGEKIFFEQLNMILRAVYNC